MVVMDRTILRMERKITPNKRTTTSRKFITVGSLENLGIKLRIVATRNNMEAEKSEGYSNQANHVESPKEFAGVIESFLTTNVVDWWLDTGATKHIFNSRRMFVSCQKVNESEPMFMGNGTASKIEGKGKVILKLTSGKDLDKEKKLSNPRKRVIDNQLSQDQSDNNSEVPQENIEPRIRHKSIGHKGIFKKKLRPDDTIEKYKAHLVAKGYRQKEGQDFFATYSPVIRITSIRTPIVIVVIHNLIIHQMDVKIAFLNGELDEEIYMQQPKGFVVKGQEHKVCKLVKSLYGLKKAPKQWHKVFDNTLLSNGFQINECDKCVYIKQYKNAFVIICLYVDDMLIIGTNMDVINQTKKMLHSLFDMKDMGEADVILGIRIQKNSNGYILTQSHYIEKTLKKFRHYDDRPVVTPLDLKIWHIVKYPLVLEGSCDANWISNHNEGKSTSGYVFTFGGAVVSWKASKQTVNTRSTMEAEFYVALTRAKNHIYNGKSRHLRCRHNTIKDLLKNGIISIDYVKSKENIADVTPCPVWGCDRLVIRAKVIENQIMAASAIAISSDSSDESVGSPPSRVILFGDIPTVIPSTFVVAPETSTIAPVISSAAPVVETTLVASPTGLDHSPFCGYQLFHHSEAPDSSDGPFSGPLCCYRCSLEEQAILIRPGEAIPFGRPYRTHLNRPSKLLTARKGVGPLPTIRLAWRHASPSSLYHHSSSSSSSSDSSPVHSSGLDAPDQAHSGSSTRDVSPRLYSSERPLHSSSHSAGPSRKRCRSPVNSVPSSTPVMGSLAPTRADLLPPRKRFRDSYLPEASIEEDTEINPIETKVDMELGIGDGDDVEDHVEIDPRNVRDDIEEYETDTSDGDTVEVGIDLMSAPIVEEEIIEPAGEDSSNSSGSRDGIVRSFEDMPIDVDDVVRDFYHHMSEVPIDRILGIEIVQRWLEADQLIARGQRVSMIERIDSLRLENLKVCAILDIERDRVNSLRLYMSLSHEEFRQVRRDRDDTRGRLRRLESYVERRLGFRP
ncbi:reverse transcriptase domain-containing protein [Tanacetum coccineum]